MNKKAQHSRNDLMVWYAASFVIVFVLVFSLYGFGIIGDSGNHGSLIDGNKITAAAIAVPIEKPTEPVNETVEDIQSEVEEINE